MGNMNKNVKVKTEDFGLKEKCLMTLKKIEQYHFPNPKSLYKNRKVKY